MDTYFFFNKEFQNRKVPAGSSIQNFPFIQRKICKKREEAPYTLTKLFQGNSMKSVHIMFQQSRTIRVANNWIYINGFKVKYTISKI